jgi:hypothetical protein
LNKTRKVARISGGYDDWIDEISTVFDFVRVLVEPSDGIFLKLFEISKFHFSVIKFEQK